MRVDPTDPTWPAWMLRLCAGYIERARHLEDDRERVLSIVMAVECLAWSLARPAEPAMPLFARAA